MFGDILQPTHLLFVLVVALLVLGPKRLPEVGRALGDGLRDFRSAISGERDERHDQVGAEVHADDAASRPAAEVAALPEGHEFAHDADVAVVAPAEHEFAHVATPAPADGHEFAHVAAPAPAEGHEFTHVAAPAPAEGHEFAHETSEPADKRAEPLA